ncbi:glycine zipper 2TM domain-containing protein [Sphingomonas rubra]|uniref:17 kDa surface antigen n=1 Tax=Sphingomonas rubra TaxID=634430 RepID=A0A1I5SCR9_9SPHN|nr:glycine zipper 2TM domain-containing protein [Sphingomonas rubra]SFP68521.1 Glycine zipper 2TM domain-containing protein [Sphingomonas rubra]
MMKSFTLIAATVAMTASALVPVGAAEAQRRHWRGDGYSQRYDRGDRYAQGYYRGQNDYRARQRCKDGDTGLLVGAIAGGLLGRTIDTRGDRTVGTLVGAGAGALAGRAIDRSDRPGYCRR